MISRYSLSGQLLETYPNARIAAEAMNTSQQYLSMAANPGSRVHTALGYLWRRGKSPDLDMKPILKKKYAGGSPLAKQQHTVGQYDLEGNLLNTFTNSKTAARAAGVHYNGVRDVIKGRGLTYGGFIWCKSMKKKIEVNPRIKEIKFGISQYDLNGRWIRSFKSGLEAEKITGIGNDNISLAIKGKTTLTAGGYMWRKGQELRINISELRNAPQFEKSRLARHIKNKRKENLEKTKPSQDPK
jgi:hypothetical protein